MNYLIGSHTWANLQDIGAEGDNRLLTAAGAGRRPRPNRVKGWGGPGEHSLTRPRPNKDYTPTREISLVYKKNRLHGEGDLGINARTI
jgi:hypothetical protein